MDPSASLVTFVAVLVFALLVAGVVWAVLRLFLHYGTEAAPASTAPRPTLRRRLIVIAELMAWVAMLLFGHAAQAAYGAPVGEPSSPVLEVVEVRECDRPLTGFGLVWTCELQAYRSTEAIEYPGSTGTVVSGAPIEPGDRVAEYSSSGWVRWLQMFDDGSQWRSLDDTGKPNLDWLPAASFLGAVVILSGLRRCWARRRSAPEDTAVR